MSLITSEKDYPLFTWANKAIIGSSWGLKIVAQATWFVVGCWFQCIGARSLEVVWNISVNTTVPILDCSPTSRKTIRGGKDRMPYLWSLQFQLLDCFPT
jgi:hypothetical protein